ncbi:tRNA uracil 4-sulfurtransferase ThiI [Micromonospora sp. WMMD1082]|uniref:tRNA uracil 4-sulfurtransferase ThiI n=1 Tax=Micromonospora sp. WMMD1082 TaxID=3016104 RepID=UPI002417346E|nr:tRNA uracil 4-sulfurtransferase ThiI [Micromonospora sp. WMMD1082]MDG4795634.1 tRNA 4-thiouridine(8) synthase ThiI [Micromonospora sp. WMMD1082]
MHASSIREHTPPGNGPATSASGQHCLLLKHGEMFLKGRNRKRFEDRLDANLRDALRDIPAPVRIRTRPGVTVVRGAVNQPQLLDRVRRVMGIRNIHPAIEVPAEWDDVANAAVALLRPLRVTAPALTIAVRAHRRDKTFPMTSSEIAGTLGHHLCRTTGATVDLTTPDVQLTVEVAERRCFLSIRRQRGQGGLPVGTSGRALVLLSGGYDSPVAAHRAMRRGLRCDFVHFTGAPYTGPSSAYKAYALARELNRYQPPGRLHIIPIGSAQKMLALAGTGRFRTIAYRRLMLRVADALASNTPAQALVTGDSLGQVASQTVTNLATVDEAIRRPVLRPLIGWDKEEIIQQARTIGTADISCLPDEDCCQLLAPIWPATSSHPDDLRRAESRLDMQSVVEKLIADDHCVRPQPYGPAAHPPGIRATQTPGTPVPPDERSTR